MSQNFNAGQIQGQGQAVADEWVQGTKDTANATKDKATDATQSAAHSAQQKKDEGAGFLQQKGDQVKNMAQGAMDNVKNTLGMGDKN